VRLLIKMRFLSEKNGMNTLANKSANVLASKVWFTRDMLFVHLQDVREIGVTLLWFPRLRKSSEEQLNDWSLIGNGVGIHWESIDEDISISALL
jgi:hypothetical protein